MTDCPTCVCDAGTTRTIFACSGGGSNIGQLSNEAALRLGREGYGKFYCLAGIAAGIGGIVDQTRAADERVVIDGCPMECAKKLMDAAGLPIDRYYVLTALGIAKSPDLTLVEEDVATALAAIR